MKTRVFFTMVGLLLAAVCCKAALQPAGKPVIVKGGGTGQTTTISQTFLFTYVNSTTKSVTVRFSGEIRVPATGTTISATSDLASVKVNPGKTVTDIPFKVSGTYTPKRNDSSNGEPEPTKVEAHGSADSADETANDDSMQQGYLSFPVVVPHEALIIQDRSIAR